MGSDLLYEYEFEARGNYGRYKNAIDKIVFVLNDKETPDDKKLEVIAEIIKMLHG